MMYLGDFAEDETVYIPFNTFSSDDPSASVTITNLADADIMVHKDGGTTQIATDGATVAIDFDAITGNHLITIDTSVSADYSTGSDYLVRIEGTTVDAATVNAWVGCFSIENRFMRGTDSAATAAALATVDTNVDAILVDTAEIGTAGAGLTALATQTSVDTIDANVDAILVDTAEIGAAGAGLTALATQASVNTVDTVVDGIAVTAAAIETDTQDIQSRIPAALVSGRMSSDMVAISGSTTAADNQEQAALAVVLGSAVTGTLSTTQMKTDLTETTNDHYVGRVVVWTSGALAGQASVISAYNGTTKLLTYATTTDAPSNTDTFVIV